MKYDCCSNLDSLTTANTLTCVNGHACLSQSILKLLINDHPSTERSLLSNTLLYQALTTSVINFQQFVIQSQKCLPLSSNNICYQVIEQSLWQIKSVSKSNFKFQESVIQSQSSIIMFQQFVLSSSINFYYQVLTISGIKLQQPVRKS